MASEMISCCVVQSKWHAVTLVIASALCTLCSIASLSEWVRVAIKLSDDDDYGYRGDSHIYVSGTRVRECTGDFACTTIPFKFYQVRRLRLVLVDDSFVFTCALALKCVHTIID